MLRQVVKADDINAINVLLLLGYNFTATQYSVYFISLEKKGE